MLELRGPISVELELDPGPEALSPEGWVEVIRRLGGMVNEFRVSGPEPVDYPGMGKVLEALESTRRYYHIATRGLWADDVRAVLTRLQKLSYLGSLLFHYPGHTPELYRAATGGEGFEPMVESLERAVASAFEVNTLTVLTASTCSVVTDVAESAFARGANYAVFLRLVAPPDDPRQPAVEQLRRAVEKIHEMRQLGYKVSLGNCVPNCFVLTDSYGCMGGISFGFVDSRGHLRPCPCSTTDGGSLLEQGVTEAWRSPPMRRWREEQLPDGCGKCSRLSYCPGGCRAAAELAGSDRDPLMGDPIAAEEPVLYEVTLDEELCPVPRYTVREEDFGWILVRANQVIPVSRKAGPVLQTFDGKTDLGTIEERFGPAALSFIYSLHVRNFVDFLPRAAE